MNHFRVFTAGFAATALVVIAASSFSNAQPTAGPTAPPRALPIPTPSFLLGGPPTPLSIIPSAPPTLAPANQPTSLPYPAYGSPAPGATTLVNQTGVPQIVDLNQAIAIGFAKSPLLASARGTYDVNSAPVLAAKLAFLPSITGTGTSTHTNRQPNAGAAGGQTANFTSLTNNSLTANLRQLIWDGGNLWAQLKGAKATQGASVDSYRRQAQTIANNVGQSYYAALAAQRTTAAAVSALRNAETQVALVQAQVNAGTAAAAAVAPLQFQAAQARATLVQSQGNELTADATFANNLGLDPNVAVAPKDDIPVNSTGAISTIPIISYDQAVARALLLRPDYDQAVKTLDAAKYNQKSAELGFFPNLQGNGSYGTSSTDVFGGTYRNANSLGLTLTIPVPFFDQGVTEGKILQAKGNVEIAQANLNFTRLGIENNVKAGLIGLITAKAKLDQVQFEYTSAVTTLQSVQAQYKVGVASIVDLVTAQNQYVTALVDQVNAAYSLRQAEQTYLFATGEIATAVGP